MQLRPFWVSSWYVQLLKLTFLHFLDSLIIKKCEINVVHGLIIFQNDVNIQRYRAPISPGTRMTQPAYTQPPYTTGPVQQQGGQLPYQRNPYDFPPPSQSSPGSGVVVYARPQRQPTPAQPVIYQSPRLEDGDDRMRSARKVSSNVGGANLPNRIRKASGVSGYY